MIFDACFPTLNVGYRFRTPGSEKFRLTHNDGGPYTVRGARIDLGIQPAALTLAAPSSYMQAYNCTNQLATELKAATLESPPPAKTAHTKTLTAFYSFVTKAKEQATLPPINCAFPGCDAASVRTPTGTGCGLCLLDLCPLHAGAPHPHGFPLCAFTLCQNIVDKATFSECTRCQKLSCPKHTKSSGKRCPSDHQGKCQALLSTGVHCHLEPVQVCTGGCSSTTNGLLCAQHVSTPCPHKLCSYLECMDAPSVDCPAASAGTCMAKLCITHALTNCPHSPLCVVPRCPLLATLDCEKAPCKARLCSRHANVKLSICPHLACARCASVAIKNCSKCRLPLCDVHLNISCKNVSSKEKKHMDKTKRKCAHCLEAAIGVCAAGCGYAICAKHYLLPCPHDPTAPLTPPSTRGKRARPESTCEASAKSSREDDTQRMDNSN